MARLYQKRALSWLAKKIKVNPELLKTLLTALIEESEGKRPTKYLYTTRIVTRGNKKRKLHIPCEELKEIQRKINRCMLRYLPQTPNVFGFSGGSIEDAIKPHLRNESILMCDIKDAFPSISKEWVFSALKDHFSKSVSHLLMLITTVPSTGKLSQGAPTSPRLFDLCMQSLDREFSKIAGEIGGQYTRYADNLFFSGEKRKIQRAEKNILDWFRIAELTPHKIRIRKLNGPTAIKILGLNLVENKVHNTRTFKRQLRLSIHHVERLLDLGMRDTPKFEKAWAKLQGQIGFVRINTLPQKILNAYLELNKRVI